MRFDEIRELMETRDVNAANLALRDGWVTLRIDSVNEVIDFEDANGRLERGIGRQLVYVLGRA